MIDATTRATLQRGVVIPASPLALTSARRLDETRQRALCRYYAAAGAGGLAVGVHTTQFEIRRPEIGLFRPVLELAAEEFDRADTGRDAPMIRVAGLCGRTDQAVAEATLVRDLGYHTGLLSLAALTDADENALIDHCRSVAEIMPLFGFYLQPSVGGRLLTHGFWRRFAEIENVVAIKIAPFNRYQTIDVVRAVVESKRDDIALYTGNDDTIVADLMTPYRFATNGSVVERRIVGGLLGHWAVWTRRAVELVDACHAAVASGEGMTEPMLVRAGQITDSNAAFFDAAHQYAGCIAGLHEVLRRQGLFEGLWCLDDAQCLSPGQSEQIDRVYHAYPHLNDDAFIMEHRDRWLAD